MTGIDSENSIVSRKTSTRNIKAHVDWHVPKFVEVINLPLYPISSFRFLHAQLLIELITDFRNSLIMDFTHQRENNIRKSQSMKRSLGFFKTVYVGVKVSMFSSTFVFTVNPIHCRAFGAMFASFVMEPTKFYSLDIDLTCLHESFDLFGTMARGVCRMCQQSHVNDTVDPKQTVFSQLN